MLGLQGCQPGFLKTGHWFYPFSRKSNPVIRPEPKELIFVAKNQVLQGGNVDPKKPS